MAVNGFPPHKRGSPKCLHDFNNSVALVKRLQKEDMRRLQKEDKKDKQVEQAAEQEAAAVEQEVDRRSVEELPESPRYDSMMNFVPKPRAINLCGGMRNTYDERLAVIQQALLAI